MPLEPFAHLVGGLVFVLGKRSSVDRNMQSDSIVNSKNAVGHAHSVEKVTTVLSKRVKSLYSWTSSNRKRILVRTIK